MFIVTVYIRQKSCARAYPNFKTRKSPTTSANCFLHWEFTQNQCVL